jgi:hypothetical protein
MIDGSAGVPGAVNSARGVAAGNDLPGGAGGSGNQSSRQNLAPRVVGGRTFFWKDGCWMDVRLKSEDRSGAKRVRLFSDEYFGLIEKDAEAASCLAEFGQQPVLIRLGEVVYLVE